MFGTHLDNQSLHPLIEIIKAVADNRHFGENGIALHFEQRKLFGHRSRTILSFNHVVIPKLFSDHFRLALHARAKRTAVHFNQPHDIRLNRFDEI